MRILYLGYWSLNDGLTTSTILPHLRLLHERPDVAAIRLVTIERGPDAQADLSFNPGFECAKISFEPLRSRPAGNVLLTKIEDFTRFPAQLRRQAEAFRPDFILARGAPAGALAYLVWQKNRLPFYVESFEPHADYMLESGVWRSWDPRYLFQRYWEKRQKQLALGLMPVAENYRRQLIAEGVASARLATVPCSVDADAFAFDAPARAQVRQQLGIAPTATVGVYVGKFGGIYYDDEAYTIFRAAADYFGADFRLLVLTPDPAGPVRARLLAAGLAAEIFFVTRAPHNEVARYLSAADFALATIKPAPCRRFCSAIKIGEYWASGLPVLLPPGIGDDSDIVLAEGGGAVFDLAAPASLPTALAAIRAQLAQPDCRLRTAEMARRHRSPDRAQQAYAALLPAQ